MMASKVEIALGWPSPALAGTSCEPGRKSSPDGGSDCEVHVGERGGGGGCKSEKPRLSPVHSLGLRS